MRCSILTILFVTAVAGAAHADPYFLSARAELTAALVGAVKDARHSDGSALNGVEPLVKALFELERQTASLSPNEREKSVKAVLEGAWADAKHVSPDLDRFLDVGRREVRRVLRNEAKLGKGTWANQQLTFEAKRQIRRAIIFTLTVSTAISGAVGAINYFDLEYPWTLSPFAGYALLGLYPLTTLPGALKSESRRERLRIIIDRCQRALW